MSNIQSIFATKQAFVGYLTAGDGSLEKTYADALALIDGGVDILEIGVPFSDPVADGATIQQAMDRALSNDITLDEVLALCARIKESTTTPVILFSYFNPLYKMGEAFYPKAAEAGIDGVLVVDLPFEEAGAHLQQCNQHGLEPIFLISPSTSLDRIKQFNAFASGMLYYVCRNGTTGVKQSLPQGFADKLAEIKQNSSLPVVAGFGIANKEMAQQVLTHADGFVVGSLFVDAAHQAQDLSAVAQSLDPRI